MTLSLPVRSQAVYEDVANRGIYEFLDEMATQGYTTLQSAVKPWSRGYIASRLAEIRRNSLEPDGTAPARALNSRQRKELAFYLADYQLEASLRPASFSESPGTTPENPPAGEYGEGLAYRYRIGFLFRNSTTMALALQPAGFHFRDGRFVFSARPILGVRYMVNANGSEYHRWWGGSFFGYAGNHAGVYASLRDNNQSTFLSRPGYFTPEPGSVTKAGSQGGVDFSEMRGGVTASVKWGTVGLLTDRFTWGDGYHGSNIFSGRSPVFPYLYLHLHPVKWFDFHYLHGWLNSNVTDSARSYYSNGIYREVYRDKYLAANLFTFIPWKQLRISFGNSIVYSDGNLHPVYLIPFMFFNAADAVRTNYVDFAGSNSQLFFTISSRQIRHLHLYLSFFVDEWKTSRLLDPDLNNFTSFKGGARLDGFPVANLALTAEYTRTQPMTYDHYLATTTFSSNDYSLGHYLRENSEELWIGLDWKPLRGVILAGSFTFARHGDNVPYRLDAGYSVTAVPFLKNITWENREVTLSARYEYASNGYFYLRYSYADKRGDLSRQPGFLAGKTGTLEAGINLGF